jgi:hypothetical protein
MPNEVVNKEDLHDVRDSLAEQMRHGFGSVNARLDVLNGRVGKGEVSDAEHRIRLDNLERIEREKRNAPVQGAAIEEQAAITRRDLKVAVAVVSAMYVLAQVAFKLIPMLAKAVQP